MNFLGSQNSFLYIYIYIYIYIFYIYIFFSFVSLKIICTKFNQPLNITFFSNLNFLFREKKT
jgi:hypothetical protein